MYPNNGWENYDKMQPAPAPKIAAAYTADGLKDGVLVPGLQAAITGVLCGGAALAITAWFDLPIWGIAGTTAAVTMAGAWLQYRSRWQWLLERLTGADLNNDGFIGQPQQLPPAAEPETVTIHLTQNEGREGAFIPLPHPEKIPALARTILDGRQYTQSALVSGGILKREEYEAIKNAMLSGGLMRYKNPDAPNAGIVVTAAGRAVLRRFLPPTLPSGEEDTE